MNRIGEIQTPLPAPQTVLIGLLVAIVVTAPELWSVLTHANTVAHEGAHVLVGIGVGRTIQSMRINSDGGGGTVMVPDSGFGFCVAAFAGYLGAGVFGLIAAKLISIGRIAVVLFLCLLLCVVMLLVVRNFFGGRVILICGALLYLILRYATTGVETAVAYSVTWFLLISGTKDAFVIIRTPKDIQDAKVLASMTYIFRSAWCFLWLSGSVIALVIGGRILIRG
jgi:cell division protein FtsL